MDRFLLVALGTEPGGTRQFPIIDLHDRYHRPYCWVDTWTDGVERVAFLNEAAASPWPQSSERREYRINGNASPGYLKRYLDNVRRELDAETAANPTEASLNDLDGPQP